MVEISIRAQLPSGCLTVPKGHEGVVGSSQLPSGLRIVPAGHGRGVIDGVVDDSKIENELG